jgi:hypothetical protein
MARNECVEKLKGRVERAESRDIGLDKRFRYFRRPQGPKPSRDEALQAAREAVAAFTAA